MSKILICYLYQKYKFITDLQKQSFSNNFQVFVTEVFHWNFRIFRNSCYKKCRGSAASKLSLLLILVNLLIYNKQIFHAFLFNIRNYSPEVINIQWHERSWMLCYRGWIISILNKKGMEYLFYYMPPTPNKIWEDKD